MNASPAPCSLAAFWKSSTSVRVWISCAESIRIDFCGGRLFQTAQHPPALQMQVGVAEDFSGDDIGFLDQGVDVMPCQSSHCEPSQGRHRALRKLRTVPSEARLLKLLMKLKALTSTETEPL